MAKGTLRPVSFGLRMIAGNTQLQFREAPNGTAIFFTGSLSDLKTGE